MAEEIEAILRRPLNGEPVGTRKTYSKADFERLEGRGAVKRAPAPEGKAKSPPANKADPAPENKAAPKAGAKAAGNGSAS